GSRLLVRSDIFELGQLLEFSNEAIGPFIELVTVRIFDGVLVLGPAHTITHGNVLPRLHIEFHGVDISELFLQPADDIRGAPVSLIEWLEVDGEPATVEGGVGAI